MADNHNYRRSTNQDQFERSIGTFNSKVDKFNQTVSSLTTALDNFTKSVGDMNQTSQQSQALNNLNGGATTPTAPLTPEERQQKAQKRLNTKGVARLDSAMKQFGADKISDWGEQIFGKKSISGLKQKMATGFGLIPKVGKGGGAGMVAKAASGIGTMVGSIVKFAGPIASTFAIAKKVFDFWDSGGFAKMSIGKDMLFGKGRAGMAGVKKTRASLEGTKAFREIDAEYTYVKPLELRQQLEREMFDLKKEYATKGLEYDQSMVKDELNYKFSVEKAWEQYRFSQESQNLEAEYSRRKDLAIAGMTYAKGMFSISERALKAVGSSTKEILNAVGKFSTILNTTLKQSMQIAEQSGAMAQHFGSSTENVLQMANLFRLMGKTSAKAGLGFTMGLDKFAKENGMTPETLFKQIVDSQEEIYKYYNLQGDALAKQAVLLHNMGVSMTGIMKGSESMVLNYKDSIKSEMQLSAMLGRNVNLSGVRAQMMMNNPAAAMAELKRQLSGTDITKMNPFEKQALSQSTGMGIDQLMQLQQGGSNGVKGQLTQAQEMGKQFAEAALQQDKAQEGARTALQLQQQKISLQLEQRQRLSMLQLELAQRIDSIQMEAKWRAYWTLYYEKNQKKDMTAAELNKEMGAKAVNYFVAGTSNYLQGMGIDISTQVSKGVMEGLSNKTAYINNAGIKGTDMRLATWSDQSVKLTEELIKSKKSQSDATIALNDLMIKTFPELKGALEKTAADNKLTYQMNVASAQRDMKDQLMDIKRPKIKPLLGGGQTTQEYLMTHDSNGNIIEQKPNDGKATIKNFDPKNFKMIPGTMILQPKIETPATGGDPLLKTTIPGGQIDGLIKKATSSTETSTILGPKLDNTFAATTKVSENIGTMNTLLDTSHQNNFTKLNELTSTASNLHLGGYNALVEQQQATNGLLELLISTTEKGKDISIDGKSVIAVTDRLRTKNYGLNTKSNNKGYSPTFLQMG